MITPEERERAYERYELYRDARANWEMNTILGGLLDCVGAAIGGYIGLKVSHFGFWPTVIGIIIGWFAVEDIKMLLKNLNTVQDASNITLADLDSVKNVEGVYTEGNHIRFEVSREKADEIIDRINAEAKEKGLSITIKKSEPSNRTEEQDMDTDLKSTDAGYINKNNQRNNGRTDEPGTDNGQWFYEMECLDCGHRYLANGTDIWQRKCPKCQGGKP